MKSMGVEGVTLPSWGMVALGLTLALLWQFDALVAHLRFDGVSNVDLLPELGRVCGFDEGECTVRPSHHALAPRTNAMPFTLTPCLSH